MTLLLGAAAGREAARHGVDLSDDTEEHENDLGAVSGGGGGGGVPRGGGGVRGRAGGGARRLRGATRRGRAAQCRGRGGGGAVQIGPRLTPC
jgi:hypothetical protein